MCTGLCIAQNKTRNFKINYLSRKYYIYRTLDDLAAIVAGCAVFKYPLQGSRVQVFHSHLRLKISMYELEK